MPESKNGEDENPSTENILRITDELVRQVNRTKKMILLMIVAIIVAIPVSWHVSPLLLGTPYNFRLAGVVTIIIAAAFFAIGARQWLVLSKWTGRYKVYKEMQSKVDEKLDFESGNSEEQGSKK
ncbi:MAG: hypothetical protein JRN15_19605 [Nitrososphaerota archaeon]|nr:hypothetical protein [Nitrososphaerota archaeon]